MSPLKSRQSKLTVRHEMIRHWEKSMSEDRELTAMGKVFAEMQPLDGEERKRVLL